MVAGGVKGIDDAEPILSAEGNSKSEGPPPDDEMEGMGEAYEAEMNE